MQMMGSNYGNHPGMDWSVITVVKCAIYGDWKITNGH